MVNSVKKITWGEEGHDHIIWGSFGYGIIVPHKFNKSRLFIDTSTDAYEEHTPIAWDKPIKELKEIAQQHFEDSIKKIYYED